MRRNRVGNVYGSGTLNDNGVFYMTIVDITEDGSETEYVVEILAWTEKTVSLRYTKTVTCRFGQNRGGLSCPR